MEETASKKIGEYIKRLRKESKVSARELGSFVGYSQSYISALENNVNKNTPSKQVLDKIASALSAIGYNHFRVRDELYERAGYAIPSKEYDDNIKEAYTRYSGYYDNLNQVYLDRPYLNLSYLLEEDNLEMYFNYYHNDIEHNVLLGEKEKVFINEIVKQMLIKDGIEERLESDEQNAIDETGLFYTNNKNIIDTENALSLRRKILRGLYDIKKNYSDDKFKHFYKENTLYYYLGHKDIFSSDDFNKDNLNVVIDQTVKSIADLENEIDNMKEG